MGDSWEKGFCVRYEVYQREALEEYLRGAKSEQELRELLRHLLEHRASLRDSEVRRLRDEAGELVERLQRNCHRTLLEELACFKDSLELQRRLLQLNGG